MKDGNTVRLQYSESSEHCLSGTLTAFSVCNSHRWPSQISGACRDGGSKLLWAQNTKSSIMTYGPCALFP